MYKKIANMLDDVATSLEQRGLLKEAATLDAVANAIDKEAALALQDIPTDSAVVLFDKAIPIQDADSSKVYGEIFSKLASDILSKVSYAISSACGDDRDNKAQQQAAKDLIDAVKKSDLFIEESMDSKCGLKLPVRARFKDMGSRTTYLDTIYSLGKDYEDGRLRGVSAIRDRGIKVILDKIDNYFKVRGVAKNKIVK